MTGANAKLCLSLREVECGLTFAKKHLSAEELK